MDNLQEIGNQIESLRKEIEKLKTQTVPVGVVEAFAMLNTPEGWLVCDGRMYREEQYPLLSKTIGSTYNTSDTPKGFFCVPNFQGFFVRGWDEDWNVDSERVFGSVEEDTIQGHCHDVVVDSSKISTGYTGEHHHGITFNSIKVRDSIGINDHTVWEVTDYRENDSYKLTDERGFHKHTVTLDKDFIKVLKPSTFNYGMVRIGTETRPKNIALLYCIKAI